MECTPRNEDLQDLERILPTILASFGDEARDVVQRLEVIWPLVSYTMTKECGLISGVPELIYERIEASVRTLAGATVRDFAEASHNLAPKDQGFADILDCWYELEPCVRENAAFGARMLFQWLLYYAQRGLPAEEIAFLGTTDVVSMEVDIRRALRAARRGGIFCTLARGARREEQLRLSLQALTKCAEARASQLTLF